MQLEQLDLPGGGLLTVYLRDCVETMPQAMERPLVLVVPGGGYNHVSPREGDPVALQFAAAGYHTAVLTYSVGEGAQNYQPLRQLNEALALLRQNAGEWHILPDKIAVCGFSAGGHLALSGAVLAQVFNMLGATTGNIVLFVIIALVGNALNLALNLLGCYVHDMRLQFLEFFGRFYKDGGKAFRPLRMQANHVEIIKEEHVQ